MARAFENGSAMVIGIAKYPRFSNLLAVVLNDTRDIAQALQSTELYGCPAHAVELVLDEQATSDGIRRALHRLGKPASSEGTVVVFFSGHGGRTEAAPEAASSLIPHNSDPTRLTETAISGAELPELLAVIAARGLAVILNACHSARAGELKTTYRVSGLKAGFDKATLDALASGAGRVLMASSRSTEVCPRRVKRTVKMNLTNMAT